MAYIETNYYQLLIFVSVLSEVLVFCTFFLFNDMGSDPRRKGYGASLSPEEIIARQFRAKCKFRAAVRFVMLNVYWLSDVEDEELGEDVKKNVMLLTRKKEKKGLLKLSDKSILSKPIEYRTEEDKAHLNKVIGGLKCFRKFPSHVKSQLAAVTYYVYYGPGRVIVREGDESHSLYFVLTGDITVSRLEYDPIIKEMVTVKLREMGPGNIFGEVSLLHGIRRTATVTTLNHCELLKLKKDDFDVVLKATVLEQWNEMKRSMRQFTYFDQWDDMTTRECCIVAKMRSYKPDDTILGDGHGLKDSVYFLLKGRCRMVEHIQVVTEFRKGFKHYRLYNPIECTSNESIVSIKDKKSSSSLSLDVKTNQDIIIKKTSNNKSLTVLKQESKGGVSVESKSGLAGVASGSKSSYRRKSKVSISNVGSKIVIKAENKESSKDLECLLEEGSKCDVGTKSEGSKGIIKTSKTSSLKTPIEVTENTEKENLNQLPTGVEYIYRNSLATTADSSAVNSLNVTPETVFMQVCLFNPTACFGVGENLKNRRIIAMSHAECLLIPRYWLAQKKKGNVWNRVQHILNHLPTTKQIFKEYVQHKKWLDSRKTMFDEIYGRRNISNDNNPSNIPYSIRLAEGLSFP